MRALRAGRVWLRRVLRDVRSSTDPGLLGAARFIGLLYGPIDRSLRIDEALKKMWRYRVAPHVGWRHMFGGLTYLMLIILVITGVLLAFYYRPSADEAYPSLQYLLSHVSFGWLIRDLHVGAANLIVIAVLAHMARVFFEAAYKPPRESNWLAGLLLLFVVLAFGATGYLLPWDQWSYWMVTDVLDAIAGTPVIGGAVASLLMGDTIVSGATLSRFFALHAIVLPWVALWLLIYHFSLVRRRGVAPRVSQSSGKVPWRASAKPPAGGQGSDQDVGMPFAFHLLRSLIVVLFATSVLVTLAVFFPRPMADAANPDLRPDALVSTWVPVDVVSAVLRVAGRWGFAAFLLVGLAFALLPLFDRRPERRLRHRPVATAFGLLFFIGFVVLWIAGRLLGGPSAGVAAHDEGVRPAIEASEPKESGGEAAEGETP